MTRSRLTKADIAAVLAEQWGCPQRMARAMLGDVLEAIVDALQSGNSVVLDGFGAFEPIETPAGGGIDPVGRPWEAPIRTRVRFRAGATLKRRVNPA